MATRARSNADAFEDDSDSQMIRPQGVIVPPNGAHLPMPSFDDEEMTPADRVAALLGEISGDEGAKVRLYRTKANGKQGGAAEWCDEFTPQEFEEIGVAGIRDKWGPGEYEIRLYASNPANGGRFSLRAKQRIPIAAPRDGSLPAGGAVSSEIGAALKAMQETQAAMLRALTERPAAPDPMAQMGAMLSMMAQMRAAMGLDGKQEKSSVSEIITAVRELKEVSGELGGGEPADPMMQALPSIVELIGKAMEKQSPAVAPMPRVHVPPPFATPAHPPLTRPQAAPPRPAAPTPQAPADAVSSRETPTPTPTPSGIPLADKPAFGEVVIDIPGDGETDSQSTIEGTDNMNNAQAMQNGVAVTDPNALLLLTLEGVAERAERGDNPADAAEYVYDAEGIPDEFFAMVGNPSFVTTLLRIVHANDPAIAARLAAHGPWLEQVRQHLVAIWNEEQGGPQIVQP